MVEAQCGLDRKLGQSSDGADDLSQVGPSGQVPGNRVDHQPPARLPKLAREVLGIVARGRSVDGRADLVPRERLVEPPGQPPGDLGLRGHDALGKRLNDSARRGPWGVGEEVRLEGPSGDRVIPLQSGLGEPEASLQRRHYAFQAESSRHPS